MNKIERIQVKSHQFSTIRELIDKLIEIEETTSSKAEATIEYSHGYYDSVDTFIEISYQRKETKEEKKERIRQEKIREESTRERELRIYEEIKKKYDLDNKR